MSITRRKFGIVTAGIAIAGAKHVMAMPTNLEALQDDHRARLFEGDLTVADEVCADKLIEHEYLSPTELPGPQILKAQIGDARGSIADLKLTMRRSWETHDTV